MSTIYVLDEFVLPHPHLGPAPLLGPGMWVMTGAIAATSAAICTLATLLRDKPRPGQVPETRSETGGL
jgi:hypothetical protein